MPAWDEGRVRMLLCIVRVGAVVGTHHIHHEGVQLPPMYLGWESFAESLSLSLFTTISGTVQLNYIAKE